MRVDWFDRCVAFLLLWLGFYAGWTIISVPLTLAGAPFYLAHLGWLGGAAGAWLGYRQRESIAAALRPLPNPQPDFWPDTRTNWTFLAGGIACTLVAAAVFIKTHDARPLWVVLAILSVISLLARKTHDAPVLHSPSDAPPQGIGVVLLGATIIALYLFVLRADADDAFYLNLPIGLQTAAHGMMAFDTMYGTPGWPLLGSNYRVESLPVLIAALSSITTLPVITVAHVVLPLIWCLAVTATLVVIGYAFFAQRWWVFAGLSLVFGLLLAGTLQGWGVHGVFRLFHGKGPLMMVVFPLLWLLVFRAEQLNLWRAFALLLALQAAATGLTANAVYLAPLALGLLLMARVFSAQAPRLIPLLAATAPALAAGLWLLLVDHPVSNQRTAAPSDTLALWDMAPNSPTIGLLAFFFGLVACASRISNQGRFATSYLLVVLLFVINPVLWPIYDSHVTGALNFRLWWALLVPMMLAASVTWALGAFARHWSGLVLVGAAAMTSVWPSSIFKTEGTEFVFSLHKVPEPAFDVAMQARALTPPNQRVLAPEDISTWLTVGTPAVQPVFVRALYLDQNLPMADQGLIAPRLALADWIDGRRTLSNDALSGFLDDLSVGLVVLPLDREFPLAGETVELLDGYRFIAIGKGG